MKWTDSLGGGGSFLRNFDGRTKTTARRLVAGLGLGTPDKTTRLATSPPLLLAITINIFFMNSLVSGHNAPASRDASNSTITCVTQHRYGAAFVGGLVPLLQSPGFDHQLALFNFDPIETFETDSFP